MGLRYPRSLIAVVYKVFMVISVILLVADGSVSAEVPPQLLPEAHSLQLVGHIGGSFKAIEAQGDFLYAAIGPRLAVIDTHDPTAPVLVGQTEVLPTFIRDLALDGSRVYAAAGSDGLSIFDVSNPVQPLELSTIIIPGVAIAVFIYDTYAFVSTESDLQIVDISQPSTAHIVGSYPVQARDIALHDNTMFVAANSGIHVLDVSTPASPQLIDQYDAPADELEINNTTLYVGRLYWVPGPAGDEAYDTLRILDISNPSNIAQLFVSNLNFPGSVPSQLQAMKFVDNRLFSYSTRYGYRASSPMYFTFSSTDVSDVRAPTMQEVRLYSTTTREYSFLRQYAPRYANIVASGNNVYMSFQGTLYIFDATTQQEVGHYSSWIANQVEVSGGVAVIAAKRDGLITVDVSDMTNPVVQDVYDVADPVMPGTIAQFSAYWPYMYAQIDSLGLYERRHVVLDISKSSDIKSVGNSKAEFRMVQNGFGYQLDRTVMRFRTIDLRTPTQPVTTTGWVPISMSDTHFTLVGSHAYMAGYYEGLYIVDVENPFQLQAVKRLDHPLKVNLIYQREKALYFFTDDALLMYDISDPETPVQTNSLPMDNIDSLVGLEAAQNVIYLLQLQESTSVLRVLRVTNTPFMANDVASYSRPGSSALSIARVGNMLYMTSGIDGLFIFSHRIQYPTLDKTTYLPIVVN